jgi:hypothetical protein
MQGHLRKMHVGLDNPVQYELLLSDQAMPLNPWLGKPIKLAYTGKIICVHCGRASKKALTRVIATPVLSRPRSVICAS